MQVIILGNKHSLDKIYKWDFATIQARLVDSLFPSPKEKQQKHTIAMGREEDYQKLINDSELEQATATFSNLNEAIATLLGSRETTIRSLKRLKHEVEESYDKSRKARIAGTTGTVAGSVLAITGFGLSFVTFGASLGLTIAGTILAAGGGLTIAGADIGYLVVSQQDLKRAQEALDVDREMMEKAKKLQKELVQLLDSLVNKYPTSNTKIF